MAKTEPIRVAMEKVVKENVGMCCVGQLISLWVATTVRICLALLFPFWAKLYEKSKSTQCRVTDCIYWPAILLQDISDISYNTSRSKWQKLIKNSQHGGG